ncbi:uncharacterized protein PGTG_03763 [Puccinia graminis f. sp. tritici CRL 75-36-700-3]|uniref:Uncharacterized protein n=1 Tax=Puccinia graminis f. sp. tritici (strain CRL 75-36-700-3 / race SCCL) TaxID=418459 RepID=E3K0I2_PUCGT|nr:uncharacterized protein PGTG_03763 [Puccinia graminis f. sp. tritici CRL 75-36-700-3]EFP77807.2 hypothetical protein PGTG_03763 [Puccinia graminis f. sp. tritici CRL 75-36-700-3]
MDEYLKGLMKLQHESIDQANIDWSAALESLKYERELRQADADWIARLEEAVLKMTIKPDPGTLSNQMLNASSLGFKAFKFVLLQRALSTTITRYRTLAASLGRPTRLPSTRVDSKGFLGSRGPSSGLSSSHLHSRQTGVRR